MKGLSHVPNVLEHLRLGENILHKAHYSRFTEHPGLVMMCYDMCQSFWWPMLQKDVLDTVSKCLVSEQVKIEHQKPGELLQP